MNKIVSLIGFTLIMVIFLSSCANIVPPVGGPRDTLSPIVLRSTPETGTRNFRGNRITLQFDEYVNVESAFDNVIVTPTQENFPQIDGRLRTVSIRLKDTLEPNTTYAINFGNAIKDVNEANPLRNFNYVFSTGNYIDSLTFSGNLTIAQTGKVDTTLIVILHRNLDDSAVAKQRPRYITKPDNKGNFTFTNLPAGVFKLYALKDEGFKRYTDNKTVFAFADSAIRIGTDNKPVNLYAFVADPGDAPANRAAAAQPKDAKPDKVLKYGANLQNGEQDLLGNLQLSFNKKLRTVDSARIILTDTLYRPISGYTLQTDTGRQLLTLQYSWKENQFFRLVIPKDAVVDSAGLTLVKNDTIRFRTRSEAAYGSLDLRINGIDFTKNPVLQWVQNDQVVRSDVLTAASWKQRLFAPGTYELRILYDANKNKVWDTGNYWKHIQPEKVITISQPFKVITNYDNGFVVTL
jgi:hypothetical protein